MTWQSGQPVVTAADEAEWHAWQRRQRIEGQRWHRAHDYRRIDHIPDREALAVIERRAIGQGFTAALNELVLAGDAALSGKLPE